MDKIFIFDLDDTLYWNVHDYCYPLLEFEKLMLDVLSHKAPHVLTMRQLAVKIGYKRLKKSGYSMGRFPGTLVETYKTICSQKNIKIDQKVTDKIWKIGMKAFDPKIYKKKGLVEGAEEVLNFLKEQEDELALLTKGDAYVQRLKIDTLELAQWFNYIHIVPFKNKVAFKIVVSKFKKTKSIYSVGNLFKSDIMPALEAGLSGIYIPYDTWESKEGPEEISKDADRNRLFINRLFIFKEIIDIKNRYKEL